METDLIKSFPVSKAQVQEMATNLIEQVMDGNTNALSAHVKVLALEKVMEIVKKTIATEVLKEAEKYGQKRFMAYGASVEMAENSVKYDYQMCGDPDWNEANVKVEVWTKAKKEREEFLKYLKKSMEIIDPASGEVIKISPPVKTSISGVKITLK